MLMHLHQHHEIVLNIRLEVKHPLRGIPLIDQLCFAQHVHHICVVFQSRLNSALVLHVGEQPSFGPPPA